MTTEARHSGSTEAPFQSAWETDPRGVNHYQSAEWYRYVGADVGSSFGTDWLRFYHPEDRDYLQREWKKSLAAGGDHPYGIDVRIRRHDGEYRWFRVQGAPHKDENGKVVKWAGTCTDIHDRKRAQDGDMARRESAESRPAARGARLTLGPLEKRLFLIVLAGLLPLIVLSSMTLVYNAQRQKQQVLDASAGTLRAIVTAVDAELKTSLASLDALAANPRLAADDFAGFHAEARELLGRRPAWTNVVLSTPQATQLMNARRPFGSPLPSRVDPESIAEAVRTGQPGFGNLAFGQLIQGYGFTARIPIIRDGKPVYVLSAVIKPESIQSLILKQRVPEGSVVAIFDRHNRTVARSLHYAEMLAKPASPQLLELLKKGEKSGFGVTRTHEGRPVYTLYLRSEFTGWSAALGVPVEMLDQPIVASYAIFGGAIAASVALGLLAAYVLGRSLIHPMRGLASAAVSVGRGEPPALPDTTLPEIRQAAHALQAAYVEREQLLRKERESRLLEQQARISAENANKAKDEFLAMLAHELRNPLAAISSASQVLELADRLPSKQAEDNAKAVIRRQVQHLSRLTDDLLDAGRVIMGKIHLERRPVDLAEIVRHCVDTLRDAGRIDGHDISLELAPAWIDGDPTRLDQIVANLIGNAAKYTPTPGRIDITLSLEGEEAVLCVRDTGLGLEPELLPRVFDLFVQGTRSLDRSQGGLGIGLTLVRRLAELHGGRADAKSDGPGHGSEFIVRLPSIAAPAKQLSSTPMQNSCTLDIVLVEDNPDVRDILRTYLELQGHRVREAVDGASGVQVIAEAPPDFAFVDIGLPLLDGYGVARAVRARIGDRTRLIAVSGYGSEEDRQRSIAAGFDMHLVKPFDFSALERIFAGE